MDAITTMRLRSASNASTVAAAFAGDDGRNKLRERQRETSPPRPMTPQSRLGTVSESKRKESRIRKETELNQRYQSLVFQQQRLYKNYVRRRETYGNDDYYENDEETVSDFSPPPDRSPDNAKYGKLELTTSFTSPKPTKKKKKDKIRHPVVECEGMVIPIVSIQ